MPDQSSAASEHSIMQQLTGPLATLPDAERHRLPAVDFPVVLRGYDRLAVDAYVKKTSQLVAELQATTSPEGAVRRALERVGEQISGILQRAHDTAEQITAQSRREAEDRVERARQEAAELTFGARARVKDLDADADRIWAERQRIVDDARDLARQLLELAEAAAERFPPADEAEPMPVAPAVDEGEGEGEGEDELGELEAREREAGEPEAGESGEGELESEERDAGVRQTDDRDAGARVAGARDAGARVAGAREAGDREAGDRVAGDRVAGDPGAQDDDWLDESEDTMILPSRRPRRPPPPANGER